MGSARHITHTGKNEVVLKQQSHFSLCSKAHRICVLQNNHKLRKHSEKWQANELSTTQFPIRKPCTSKSKKLPWLHSLAIHGSQLSLFRSFFETLAPLRICNRNITIHSPTIWTNFKAKKPWNAANLQLISMELCISAAICGFHFTPVLFVLFNSLL